MRAAGIDYSSRKVAVAVIEDSSVRLWSWAAPKRVVGREATQMMFEAVEGWASQTSLLLDAHVVLESPITGASNNRQTAAAMAAGFGGLWFCCMFHGAEQVSVAAPSQWKKALTGNGASTKEQVQRWLALELPDVAAEVSGDDEADAVCLALMAHRLLVG